MAGVSLAMSRVCNSTIESLGVEHELPIAGNWTFHDIALAVGGACTVISTLMSSYLIWMHALHYTKPSEQRQLIRIIFMVPVYAVSAFLQIYFYHNAIYFAVISDCYEAFSIASFFTLLCYYIAPNLHDQKNFFRGLNPIKPWVWPLDWMAACCCGQRGPWRTPRSGLTWFNIIWIGVYHYCFVRVAMTITAVVTQYFHLYCESSNSPFFSHVWVLSINSVAVTIAMYCLIQFYVQLRHHLAAHQPFLKVLAIKLVVFLVFWQSIAISFATTESINLLRANDYVAYPDIKIVIPALLICIEMALFSVMHMSAYPWKPYHPSARPTLYPLPDKLAAPAPSQRTNVHYKPSGGPLGLVALWHAINLWDMVKAFIRGLKWLFCGIRHRKEDPSYHYEDRDARFIKRQSGGGPGGFGVGNPGPGGSGGVNGDKQVDYLENGGVVPSSDTGHLPIADQFRRSRLGLSDPFSSHPAGGHGVQIVDCTAITAASAPVPPGTMASSRPSNEEHAVLINHAQHNPRAASDSDSIPAYNHGRHKSTSLHNAPTDHVLQRHDAASVLSSPGIATTTDQQRYMPNLYAGRESRTPPRKSTPKAPSFSQPDGGGVIGMAYSPSSGMRTPNATAADGDAARSSWSPPATSLNFARPQPAAYFPQYQNNIYNDSSDMQNPHAADSEAVNSHNNSHESNHHSIPSTNIVSGRVNASRIVPRHKNVDSIHSVASLVPTIASASIYSGPAGVAAAPGDGGEGFRDSNATAVQANFSRPRPSYHHRGGGGSGSLASSFALDGGGDMNRTHGVFDGPGGDDIYRRSSVSGEGIEQGAYPSPRPLPPTEFDLFRAPSDMSYNSVGGTDSGAAAVATVSRNYNSPYDRADTQNVADGGYENDNNPWSEAHSQQYQQLQPPLQPQPQFQAHQPTPEPHWKYHPPPPLSPSRGRRNGNIPSVEMELDSLPPAGRPPSLVPPPRAPSRPRQIVSPSLPSEKQHQHQLWV